jgi:EAL domain-containing protein (putative c-di-GMP-specific phosphodiesterase class I)
MAAGMSARNGNAGPDEDLAALEIRFEKSIAAMIMFYQPIVHAADRSIFGYEALLRSNDPDMRMPYEILAAAERLNRWPKLGRLIRAQLAQVFSAEPPERGVLFVNLHALDLLDRSVSSPYAPLARIAHRVILEITEREGLENLAQMRNHVADLKQQGYRIAIDDLGAGAARMKDFAVADTDFVKLDISVVRDVDQSEMKQQFVGSIIALCHSQGIGVIGEGVETAREAEVLESLGCDYLQGYYLARPGPPFPAVLQHPPAR